MKEAAGEANMTVITIVLIGVVAAAGAILIPRVMDSVGKRNACSELGGSMTKNECWYKYTDPITGAEKKHQCVLTKDPTTKQWDCE